MQKTRPVKILNNLGLYKIELLVRNQYHNDNDNDKFKLENLCDI